MALNKRLCFLPWWFPRDHYNALHFLLQVTLKKKKMMFQGFGTRKKFPRESDTLQGSTTSRISPVA